jgi:hypothetical protein
MSQGTTHTHPLIIHTHPVSRSSHMTCACAVHLLSIINRLGGRYACHAMLWAAARAPVAAGACSSILHQCVLRSGREWDVSLRLRDNAIRWGWCGRGLHSCMPTPCQQPSFWARVPRMRRSVHVSPMQSGPGAAGWSEVGRGGAARAAAPAAGGGGNVNEVQLMLSNLPFANWLDFKAFYCRESPEPRARLSFEAFRGTCTVTCTSQERADAVVQKFDGFSLGACLRISAALLAASNRGRASSQLKAAPSWPKKVYSPEDEHAAIYSPVAARTLDPRFMIELHGLRRDKSAHELFDFLAACFPRCDQSPLVSQAFPSHYVALRFHLFCARAHVCSAHTACRSLLIISSGISRMLQNNTATTARKFIFFTKPAPREKIVLALRQALAGQEAVQCQDILYPDATTSFVQQLQHYMKPDVAQPAPPPTDVKTSQPALHPSIHSAACDNSWQYFFVLPNTFKAWHDVLQQRLDSDPNAHNQVRDAIRASWFRTDRFSHPVEVASVNVDLYNQALTTSSGFYPNIKEFIGRSKKLVGGRWYPQNKRFLVRIRLDQDHVKPPEIDVSGIAKLAESALPTLSPDYKKILDQYGFQKKGSPRCSDEPKDVNAHEIIQLSVVPALFFGLQVSVGVPMHQRQLELSSLGTAFLDLIMVRQAPCGFYCFGHNFMSSLSNFLSFFFVALTSLSLGAAQEMVRTLLARQHLLEFVLVPHAQRICTFS